MVSIDCKKAYDIILQTWTIECLKIFKISEEVKNFITRTMKIWKVELEAGEEILGEVKIQREIFQGD